MKIRNLAFVCLFALLSSAAYAQLGGSGTIQGTVKDPTGAVMVAVTVYFGGSLVAVCFVAWNAGAGLGSRCTAARNSSATAPNPVRRANARHVAVWKPAMEERLRVTFRPVRPIHAGCPANLFALSQILRRQTNV